MPTFTNQAQLSYNGVITNSNVICSIEYGKHDN